MGKAAYISSHTLVASCNVRLRGFVTLLECPSDISSVLKQDRGGLQEMTLLLVPVLHAVAGVVEIVFLDQVRTLIGAALRSLLILGEHGVLHERPSVTRLTIPLC